MGTNGYMDFKENVPKQTPFPIRLSEPSKPVTPIVPTRPSRSSCQAQINYPDQDGFESFVKELCSNWIELTGFRAQDWNLVELQLDKLMFVVEKKAFTNTNRHFIKLAGDLTEKKRLLQRNWLAIMNSCHRPICYVKVACPKYDDDTRELLLTAKSSDAKVVSRRELSSKGERLLLKSKLEVCVALLNLTATLLRYYLVKTKSFSNWKAYLIP
eukprot:Gregarina_sp_Pseudo_9__2865@NODE_3091_length_755_cov_59_645251_g2728_i1_p1_GENE_NODE_3091_length_755_cov_59_645251_g2728_i1NODE_3091_length_755_cov_59_645251_g2728_i1_p1_ORF_typecomplete_len213_score11_35_NODE_3091_length_755_cov_59_645251_g2728_i183721